MFCTCVDAVLFVGVPAGEIAKVEKTDGSETGVSTYFGNKSFPYDWREEPMFREFLFSQGLRLMILEDDFSGEVKFDTNIIALEITRVGDGEGERHTLAKITLTDIKIKSDLLKGILWQFGIACEPNIYMTKTQPD